MYENIMLTMWIIVIPFIIGFLAYQLAPKYELSFGLSFIFFGILPFISWIIAIILTIDCFNAWHTAYSRANRILECKKCGLYVRGGYLAVQRQVNDKRECVNCKHSGFDDTNLPLGMKIKSSDKISLWGVKTLFNRSSKIMLEEVQRTQEEKMLNFSRKKGMYD